MNTTGEGPYCGEGLIEFNESYAKVHGYASLVVCMFGSVANLLNIVVLTRREMSSPTNAILTGMAIADLLVMLAYIPFSCHMYIYADRPLTDKFTYAWALFILFHANFTQVFHTVSIWLTVTLAVWRFIAVAYPQRNREWCDMQRTVAAIACGYILCPVLCIPQFMTFSIGPIEKQVDSNGYSASPHAVVSRNVTLYFVGARGSVLKDLNFWLYGVVIKIIPCTALTVLSLRLICALVDTKKRREALTSGSRKSNRNAEKERQTDRTTRMLLAVLLLFVITEFPQGILGLLSVEEKFFKDCYSKLGDVMDILALINSAINFAIYCAMSRQFRTTFTVLFRPRWMAVPTVDNGQNNHTTTVVTQV